MPLVINSLGGRHTHTYRHRRQKQFQETSHVPAFGWCTPGLKIKASSFSLFQAKIQSKIEKRILKAKLLISETFILSIDSNYTEINLWCHS